MIASGMAEPRRLEMLRGVVEGEEVILHPGDRVHEGTLVVEG